MNQKSSSRRKRSKSVLRLPDLEHAKAAVLNSLNSTDAKRGYRHAIDEFVDWHCSEPRLAFNSIVVLRYRSHLESRQLAPVAASSGFDQPSMIALASSRILELGAQLWKGCRQTGDYLAASIRKTAGR